MWSMLFMTGWLLAAGIMDIRTRRVPVWMLVLGGALAMWAALSRQSGYFEMLKGILPGGLLLLTALATKKAGYGDGIVLAWLGLALGGDRSLLLSGLGLFLTSLCAMVLLALRRVRRDTGLPFLPFLAAAWLLVAGL